MRKDESAIDQGEIITFYGPDGCGKTSIAEAISRVSNECFDKNLAIIGGSSYQDWLTPKIAKQFLGYHLPSVARTENDRSSLYEDIAIACYGYAEYLSGQGQTVLIDSDPYFKRLVWASMQKNDNDSFAQYYEKFELKFSQALGSTSMADTLIIVNVTDIGRADESAVNITQDRLTARGINTMYDPVNSDEGRRIHQACNYVLEKIILSGKCERTQVMDIHEVTNYECTDTYTMTVLHTKIANHIIGICHGLK